MKKHFRWLIPLFILLGVVLAVLAFPTLASPPLPQQEKITKKALKNIEVLSNAVEILQGYSEGYLFFKPEEISGKAPEIIEPLPDGRYMLSGRSVEYAADPQLKPLWKLGIVDSGIKMNYPDYTVIHFNWKHSKSRYTEGIYYSSNDTPTSRIYKSIAPLEPYEDGWIYKDDPPNNAYFTSKICDNWYYFYIDWYFA